MKVCRADYPELGNWQILYKSEEEAQAVADYQEEMLLRGTVEKAEWQVEENGSNPSYIKDL